LKQDLGHKNSRMAYVMVGLVGGMLGLAFASVPLYDLFCRVTGYGGTPKQSSIASISVIDRDMSVRFAANVNRDMPWDFKPLQSKQSSKVGAQNIAYFEVYNPTDKPIVGTATFNVTPHKAGEYFIKLDCFCFTEQLLEPGERRKMPVVYYVDTLLDEDRNLDEVGEITLSYTFFVDKDSELLASYNQ